MQELRVERNVHKLLDLLDEEKEGSRGRGFKGSSVNGRTNKGVQHTGARSQEPGARSQESGTTGREPNKPINQSNQSNQFNQFNQQTNQPVVRATFFMLGWIARKLPGLIREISARGHEVASHGVNHGLCTNQPIEALLKDLTDSKKLLEDIIGGQVQGYRAPSFSINNDILKVIEDAGYSYDSSYNSFDKHGRYGKLSVNGFSKNGIAYKVSDNFYELPVSNLSIKPIAHSPQPVIFPFGGGGYFRLFPYFVFKMAFRESLKMRVPTVSICTPGRWTRISPESRMHRPC